MTIMTEDGKYSVGVGGTLMFSTLYLTAKKKIIFSKFRVAEALKFLKTGTCKKANVEKTLKQLELIKEELARLDFGEVIFESELEQAYVLWKNNVSVQVKTCADFFTTDEGKNLVDELIALLQYAKKNDLAITLP